MGDLDIKFTKKYDMNLIYRYGKDWCVVQLKLNVFVKWILTLNEILIETHFQDMMLFEINLFIL